MSYNTEPASILELTSTVLDLSRKLYKFFKAVRDALKEIQEYLFVLDSVRRVFLEVRDYPRMYQKSAFYVEDGICLRVVQPLFKDCETEFTLQLVWTQIQPCLSVRRPETKRNGY